MAYSYDFFVAEMKCPTCGTVSRADDSTEMYTYIRDNPAGEFLRVGDRLDVDRDGVEHGRYDGYYRGRTPAPNEPVRLLNPWRCPTDGAYNWAQIVVRNGLITAIEPVPLDRAILESSHLISNDVDFVAASLTNASASEMVGAASVAILLEQLP